jgi:nucleoside-diphosphate-sugar epimerase
MKTILVTGGAGFVGSHACKALSPAGQLPVTFNVECGHERAIKYKGVVLRCWRFLVGPGRHRP